MLKRLPRLSGLLASSLVGEFVLNIDLDHTCPDRRGRRERRRVCGFGCVQEYNYKAGTPFTFSSCLNLNFKSLSEFWVASTRLVGFIVSTGW